MREGDLSAARVLYGGEDRTRRACRPSFTTGSVKGEDATERGGECENSTICRSVPMGWRVPGAVGRAGEQEPHQERSLIMSMGLKRIPVHDAPSLGQCSRRIC